MDYLEAEKILKVKRNTWLITGAAGFIGSNLLEKLLVLNQNVICVDNYSTGSPKNIEKAIEEAARRRDVTTSDIKKNNLNLFENDINKLDVCESVCKSVDFVLHQAAIGSVPRSIENPILSHESNVNGFLNMLIACKNTKIKKFIFASSSSVYGDIADRIKIESSIGEPLSPYAGTKLVNEIYANIFQKTYGLNFIGLRYFNIYGKNQDPEGAYAAVVPKWIKAILNDDEVIINGDGSTSRDFCYIDNVIQMNILSALSSDNASNNIYNVGLNENTNLNSLFKIINESVNELTGKKYDKKPIYEDFRKGDVKHSQANILKAKNLLGYNPSHNIVQGIKETIPHYIN